jgi:diguanylate cyclase (GGDEF)-like protein
MNENGDYNIPVAAAGFMVKLSSLDKIEYVFTDCNHAFVDLFCVDVTGMNFENLPENLTYLFKEVEKSIKSNKLHFIYGGFDKPKYNVKLGSSGDCYTVCIDDFSDQYSEIENQLRLAVNNIQTGIIATDHGGRITYLNSAAERLTGWGEDAVGKAFTSVLSFSLEDSICPLNVFSPEVYDSNNIEFGGNVILKSKAEKAKSITFRVTPVSLQNENSGYVVFFNDVSDQKKREREIAYLSYHDKLTGLYNRAYFEKKLKAFDEVDYLPVSIIMGDANGLKMTNDIFGHHQGDMLLVTIANILSLACRDNDVVARYGGDEFIVLMPNTTLDDAARVCKNILTLCGNQSSDQSKVSISLGYACKSQKNESMPDILNVAENFMYRHKLLESRSYRSSVISSLQNMLFEKSFETEEHAMRLTGLCSEAGRRLGLSQSDLNDLELFSMLHDIGKIGVNDQILLKPGKLTDEEWIQMRKHCEIGYRIAQSAPELSHVADYILCHHERFDGKGYPQGMKGNEIPLLSRILSVADSYDAMVNDRYYRKALSKEVAIGELIRCSGTQFDPEIVKVFLKILEPNTAELSETLA